MNPIDLALILFGIVVWSATFAALRSGGTHV